LSRFVQALKAPDAATRGDAVDKIAGLGAAGKEAVPALAAVLADKDEGVRGRAARALGALGPVAGAAAPALGELLKDSSPRNRAYAAYALGKIGDAAKPVVPALVVAVKDEDRLVRIQSIKAIAAIRPGPDVTVPLFLDLLNHATPGEVATVLSTMASLGEAGVPRLVDAMKHPEARYWVCLILAEIGPPAQSATPAVLECLNDADPLLRREALLCLGHIKAGSAAVPAIITALDDKDESVRHAAAVALGFMGPDAKAAASRLKLLRNDDNALMKTVAAWALTRIEPTNEAHKTEALPLLTQAVKNENPRVRAGAAHALGELDGLIPAAQRAAPVATLLGDAEPQVRSAAIEALMSIGPEAVPAIVAQLGSANARGPATEVLAHYGAAAKSAVGALVGLLQDPSDNVRASAIVALGSMGADARAAIPALGQALAADKSHMVRYNAVIAIGAIDAAAGRDALTKAATSDKDRDIQEAAKAALK
jgi:HEAT repeat protein